MVNRNRRPRARSSRTAAPPLGDVRAAANGAQFDTADDGAGYGSLPIAAWEFGCDYFLEVILEPDDGLQHGGLHIVLGYNPPDQRADITAELQNYHSAPCQPISVPGAISACVGANADLPNTHFMVLTTERTLAAVSVTRTTTRRVARPRHRRGRAGAGRL
ncbi:hypothetical protein [Pseudonocardia nigra]|uniref:hypothetical protein n=1 Tax=Pseudonocardia nigra TaxID=1921578 RepID=UPI001C5E30C2|nr:hypothetical protein [Pseudonocardia nigra]